MDEKPISERIGSLWDLVYSTEESLHSVLRLSGPGTSVSQLVDFTARRVSNFIDGPVLRLVASGPLRPINSKARHRQSWRQADSLMLPPDAFPHAAHNLFIRHNFLAHPVGSVSAIGIGDKRSWRLVGHRLL